MSPTSPRACAVVVAVALLTPAAASAEATREQRLDRGEVLLTTHRAARGGDERVGLEAVINAPPAVVWALISDCARYAKTMERIKHAKQLSRRGKRVVCSVTVDMPFPYSDLTAVTEAVHEVGPSRWSRRWRLLSGDYHVNSGSWELTAFRGDARRTHVAYRIRALPKVWVPDWLRRKAQRRSLPRMITRLRELSSQRAGQAE